MSTSAVPPHIAALDPVEEAPESTLTLGARGRLLPVGLRHAGSVHREFELRPWDYALEEELGAIVEAEPNMAMGSYIAEIVGRVVTRVGTVDLASMKRSERRLLLYRTYMSDVLYMYVHVRILALGAQLRLRSFPCKACRRPVDFVGDLNSVEVVAYDEPPEVEVDLEKGVPFGDEFYPRARVSGVTWGFMETTDPSVLTNPAKTKLRAIEFGLLGVDGVSTPVPVEATTLRRMLPVDINRLVGAIDEAGGGAVMQIEGECPHCSAGFAEAIDWGYEDFFGRSSR